MTLFDRCISVILRSEGGFQCDPDDIGNWTREGCLKGTNFGIAARYFPDIDIKNLTVEQAKDIYYKHFWKPMNLEGINDDLLVLHVFDMGVNAGKKTSIRMLQRLIEVKQDGLCGPRTTTVANTLVMRQKVIEGYGLLTNLCEYFIYERRQYYAALTMRRPVTKKYLKGWYSRIEKTKFD